MGRAGPDDEQPQGPWTNAPGAAPAGATPAERALHERVESLTVELAARDQRIAQLDATISALLAQLGPASA